MRSDEDLLQGILRKDPLALEELTARCSARLEQVIHRIVRDRDVAQDLVQETFLRVWTHGHQWQGQGTLLAWMLRIATNLSLNHLRSASRHRTGPLEPPAAQEDADSSEPAWLADVSAMGPLELAELAERRDLLRQAIGHLPEAKREILRMVFDEDMTVADAARLLGIPPGTAKSRLHYAIRKINDLLRTPGQEGE